MKRSILSIILVLAMCLGVFALAGCRPKHLLNNNGNNDVNDPAADPLVGYDGSAVTITFYHTMSATNLQPVLNDAIARFNAIYPNITVEHKQVGDYDAVRNQIKTELTVGGQPNIAYCYPDHVALYNVAKAVVPLDGLIASQATVTRADGTTEVMGLTETQIGNFIEGFYNEGRAFGDDKMYTLPLSKSTEVLYYNKTFFDANGYTVPKTWDEMEVLCQTIKAAHPESTPLGYDSEANWFITMCEQYGSAYTSATKVDGTNYLFNNETNHAFVNRFASWYKDGLVTTKGLSGGYTSDAFKKADGDVGKSYMSIGSSAGATHQAPDKVNDAYPFEVGIAPIPQVDVNNPKVISQGPSVCIFQQENVQEVYASWLFVKFITTDVVFQAEFSEASGYIPVIKNVNEDPAYQEFMAKANGYKDGIAATSVKACLEQEKSYYVSPAFKGSSKAREEVELLMQSCFSDYAAAADKLAMIKEKFAKAVEECEY
jgi:multiple sugar transport system substrate-binding protein